jgi:hypothetical protein
MATSMTSEAAEAIALRALGFLAAQPERLEPFLASTGLGPSTLRAAATQPGFLAAVLDHLAGSDSLLLEFAGNLSLNPEIVGQARSVLSGADSGEFA